MSPFVRRLTTLAVAALIAACAYQKEDQAPAAETPEVAGQAVPPPASKAEEKRAERDDARLYRDRSLRAAIVDQAMSVSSDVTSRPAPAAPVYRQQANTEKYQHFAENPVQLAAEQPVSTFSIDVDTGSYANVRRYLNDGSLPPQDAVRVEEMLNYFDYQYAAPESRSTPFRVSTELAAAPWSSEAWLLRIGIKAFEVPARDRPPANLVFLIDVSGSMQTPQKLPLLKNAFRLLTDQLTERDRVSMVVYAGRSGVVLEPTAGDRKQRIREAIDRLEAGGSTNGAEGIERAYQLAHQTFVKGGVNRVVLATDGDFNVGIVSFEALVDMAERQRASGVALTALGFGTENLNDQLLERLADAGNGNYAYVDTLSEARKVLVTELSSTLFTVAKDVKIQVEFNPAEVREYRLVGYENRMLAREDFNNDKVDAGEIGAGHRVTALYEIIPAEARGKVDPLRYSRSQPSAASRSGEIAHVRLRYKLPESDSSELLEYPIGKSTLVASGKLSADLRFAASVAAFGQLLRGGKYVGDYTYDDVAALAQGALDRDPEGYRREFISLVKLAGSLTRGEPARAAQISQ